MSIVYGPYYVEAKAEIDGVQYVSRSWPLGLVESVRVDDPGILHTKEDEVYVFHIYTNKDGGKLKKRKFGESEFDSIIKKFEDKAQRIANWNPNDSLSPPYNTGEWCSNCDYQTTCPEYR